MPSRMPLKSRISAAGAAISNLKLRSDGSYRLTGISALRACGEITLDQPDGLFEMAEAAAHHFAGLKPSLHGGVHHHVFEVKIPHQFCFRSDFLRKIECVQVFARDEGRGEKLAPAGGERKEPVPHHA